MPSNFNADIATQQASGRGDTRISGSLITGQVRNFRATYTCTGTEAAADTITLGKLPVGANFIRGKVSNEACGGTGFVLTSIGITGTAAAIATTDIAISAAGCTEITVVAGLPLAAFDGATDIIATLDATSGSMTAGKQIVFDIQYFV